MIRGIFGALVLWGCSTSARSEVVVEFDGIEWGGEIDDVDLEERVLKEGICIVADDESGVGKLLEGWGLDQLQPHAIRFVLRGVEGRGAVIDSGKGMEGDRKASIVVTCEQAQVTVAHVGEKVGFVETASMNVDLDGADKFLEIVKQGVRASEEAREVPVAVLMIRSKCSYGLMVRVLQMMRAGGCRNMVIKVDDEFPSMDFEVKVDPDVIPPVGGAKEMARAGRIIVNIHVDGSVTGADGTLLETDAEIKTYVERSKDEVLKTGKEPRLFLRGDQDAVFRFSRSVIRIGADAGVDQVIFATYPAARKDQKNQEEKKDQEEKEEAARAGIEMRETDLNMTLPPNGGAAKNDLARKVRLRIEKGGRILMEGPEIVLDADGNKREVPLLASALDRLKNEEGLVSVDIQVDSDAQQQRVIDVLNALAGAGISSVTFSDAD